MSKSLPNPSGIFWPTLVIQLDLNLLRLDPLRRATGKAAYDKALQAVNRGRGPITTERLRAWSGRMARPVGSVEKPVGK